MCPFFRTIVQSEAVTIVVVSLLETSGWGRCHGAGRWLIPPGRDGLGATGWSVLVYSLWGRRGTWTAGMLYTNKSLCCSWKPIKVFPVPLSSLESQPYLPRVWALIVGPAGYSLVTPSSFLPVQSLTWNFLRVSVVHYLCACLTPSVTGYHLTSIWYVIYKAFSGPKAPLSFLTALSDRSHIPCLIGN